MYQYQQNKSEEKDEPDSLKDGAEASQNKEVKSRILKLLHKESSEISLNLRKVLKLSSISVGLDCIKRIISWIAFLS